MLFGVFARRPCPYRNKAVVAGSLVKTASFHPCVRPRSSASSGRFLYPSVSALVRWGDGTAEQVGTTRPIAQTDLPIGSDRVELWFRLNLAMGGFCGDETGWSN